MALTQAQIDEQLRLVDEILAQDRISPLQATREQANHELALTGRAGVKGLSSLLDIASLPQMAGKTAATFIANQILPENQKVTYENIAPAINWTENAAEGYDKLTGGIGKPQTTGERIYEAGISNLIGSKGLAAPAKAPAFLSTKTPTEVISALLGGAGTQAAAEVTDNPLVQIGAGVASASAPQIISGVAKQAPRIAAEKLGVSPERVAALEASGLPINIPSASESPAVKGLANVSANLMGGKKLYKQIGDAFAKAEEGLKTVGYTGTTTPTDAGNIAIKALDRWKIQGQKHFDEINNQLNKVIPRTTPIKIDSVNDEMRAIAASTGMTDRQINEALQKPAFKEISALYSDAQKSHTRLSRLGGEELANLKQYESQDVGKLYELKDALVSDINNPSSGRGANVTAFIKKYPDAKNFFTKKLEYSVGGKINAIAGDAKSIQNINKQVKSKESLLSEIEDAIALKNSGNDGAVQIGAIDWAREKIGHMIKEDAAKGRDTALTDRAYGLLAKLTEDHAFQTAGNEGRDLLRKRNIMYKNYIDESTSMVNRLQKRLGDDPAIIFDKLTLGDKKGAGSAMRILSKMTASERAKMRDAIIEQKGMQDGAFSITKYAGEYKRLSPEAKRALFMDNPSLMKAHDNLIGGVDLYKDVGKFGNPSRSGYTNHIATLIQGGVGISAGTAGIVGSIPAAAGAAATAYGINRGLSSMLASSKLTKLLAAASKAPDEKSYSKIASALSKAAIAEGIPEAEINAIVNPQPEPSSAPASPQTLTPQQIDEQLRLIDEIESQQPQAAPQGSAGSDTLGAGDSALQRHEGLRHQSYNDNGNRSIGYGFNMDSGIGKKVWQRAGIQKPFDAVRAGQELIDDADAQRLFVESRNIAIEDAASTFKNFDRLSQSRKDALVNLAYQHGKPALQKKTDFIDAVNNGNFNKAVIALNKGGYFDKYPNRGRDLMRMLLSGGNS